MHTESVPFAIILFVGMLGLVEVGRRIGKRRWLADPEGSMSGLASIEGAIFALFGLLIAFTFSGAATRFEARRQLILDEANAIGTAWSYLDLLPADDRPALRELFRRYTDARIACFEKLPDVPAAEAELARSAALQGEIWKRTVLLCQAAKETSTTLLVIDALNTMNNVTTTRTAVLYRHPPPAIYFLLLGLGLCSALLAGYGMAKSKSGNWLHAVAFAAVIGFSVFVIRDLEYPRLGLIRVTGADRTMTELRAKMQ